MYRYCPECNSGKGLRLVAGQIECPETHDDIVCMLEVGDIIGDFRVEQVMLSGQGGYAKVYRARPLQPGYPELVALKVASANQRTPLSSEATVLAALGAAGVRQIPQIFFISEAHQAPMLDIPGRNNPYVGRVVLDLEPFYFLAIEYLKGQTLRDLLASKRGKGLGSSESVRLIHGIGNALAEVHSRRYCHFDIKPDNIMLVEGRTAQEVEQSSAEVVLIDFGSAMRFDAEQTTWSGTAPYAPREQLNQDYPDTRADIHALGVVFFEMLSATLPYKGDSATALARAVMKGEPITLESVDRRLAKFDPPVQRALASNPDDRYRDVGDFLVDLDDAARSKSTSSVPASAILSSTDPLVKAATTEEASGGIASIYVKSNSSKRDSKGKRRLMLFGGGSALLALAVILLFLLWLPGSTVVQQCPPLCPLNTSIVPTQISQIASGVTPTVATPGAGEMFIGMDLLEPAIGQAFIGDALPVIKWSDPNGALGSEQLYRIVLERPDGTVQELRSDDNDIHLGRDKLGVTDGQFKWQVMRVKVKNGDPNSFDVISYTSGSRTFIWYTQASPTPTSTSTPTLTATPTSTSTVIVPTPTMTTVASKPSPTQKISTKTPISQRPTATSRVANSPTVPIQPTEDLPPSPIPTIEVIPSPTFTMLPTAIPTTTPPPSSTPVPPTATRVPPTPTQIPTITPTITPKPRPTRTRVPPPPPVRTPVPPPVGTRMVVLDPN